MRNDLLAILKKALEDRNYSLAKAVAVVIDSIDAQNTKWDI